jgi:ketosteroid isomerase-like protein
LLVPRLAPDFTGIGPLGFTLTKTNWLDRHATGALTYDTYRLEELHPRAHGDTAVVTAHQITEGTYQGHPLPSQLRVTLALVRQTGRWRLTVAHMSFIAGTPGAPPIPDRP